MKSCREFRARIFGALEGTIAIEDVLALESHVHECDACRALHARARALQSAFASLPEPPLERVDVERNVTAIREAIERRERVAVARPRRARWIAAAFVLAAAVVVAFVALRGDDETLPPPIARTQPVEPIPSVEPEPLPEPVEVVADEPPAPREEPIDLARLEFVRADVRARLDEARVRIEDGVGADACAAFVDELDRSLREYVRASWPVATLIAGFATDRDPRLANAALRWLGLRGGRTNWPVLKSALQDPERRRAACLALADARAADLLALAVVDPSLRALALDAARARDDALAADVVEKALRAPGARSDATLEPALARTLALLESTGAARALALVSDNVITETDVLSAWESTPNSAEHVAGALRMSPRGIDVRVGLRAVVRLHAVGCETWLETAAHDLARRSDDAAAMQAIAAIGRAGDAGALRALLRARDSGRFERRSMERTLSTFLESFPDAATTLARECVLAKNRAEVRNLHAVLLENPSSSLAPSCVAIAASEELSDADRRFVLLVAAEIGDAALVEPLVELARELRRSDRDVRAACLVALRAHGTRDDVLRALESDSARTKTRVLALLDGRDARERPATSLLKISRELESLLALPQS